MNIHIEKIEKSLTEFQSSVEELKKECPGIMWGVLNFNEDIISIHPREYAEKLQNRLNAERLRKIALEKLTPQDREILRLY
jgi:archaellum component FlaC